MKKLLFALFLFLLAFLACSLEPGDTISYKGVGVTVKDVMRDWRGEKQPFTLMVLAEKEGDVLSRLGYPSTVFAFPDSLFFLPSRMAPSPDMVNYYLKGRCLVISNEKFLIVRELDPITVVKSQ